MIGIKLLWKLLSIGSILLVFVTLLAILSIPQFNVAWNVSSHCTISKWVRGAALPTITPVYLSLCRIAMYTATFILLFLRCPLFAIFLPVKQLFKTDQNVLLSSGKTSERIISLAVWEVEPFLVVIWVYKSSCQQLPN